MLNKRHLPFYLIASIVFLTSCTNDFELNDPWSDQTIVYAMINQVDTAQYFRINRAFLGDADAYEMAQHGDSTQYESDLRVSLTEYSLTDKDLDPYNDANWKPTGLAIELFKVTDIEKDSLDHYGNTGTFGTSPNYLYKTQAPIKGGYKYLLNIKVPGKTDEISSEAITIHDLTIESPLPNELNTSKIPMSDYNKVTQTVYRTAYYGKAYQVVLRFHYIEILGNDTTYHYVDLDYPRKEASNIRMPNEYEGDKLSQQVGGSVFYNRVGGEISKKPDVKRKAGKLDFIVYAGGKNLNTYLNSSESTTGYNQQANFSNVKNAIGLFDARYFKIVPDKELSGPSIDSLAYGYYTKDLNFANQRGFWD